MERFLASPTETRRVLEKFELRAKKKFGQNFLIDANIVHGIVETAEVTKEDCILEIGPGIGTMTGCLAQQAGKVICVEIDRSLKPVLAETLQGFDNIEIIWDDVLNLDLREVAACYNGGKPLKVVANLPYYVTTPILMELMKGKGNFESITLMVQKEVAERICAAPGGKEYGAMTLAVQYYTEPEIAMQVSASCFLPRPNVDSSVIHLKARKEPPVQADEELLFALIRASFNQRRKTLANGISHGLAAERKQVTREQVVNALNRMGLPEDIRGEKLSLAEFAELSNLL